MPERKKGVDEESLGKRIIVVAPEEIASDNPQISIINPASYQAMNRNFTWVRFDRPQIARVLVYEEHEARIIYGVVDGHTRSQFCLDRKTEGDHDFDQIETLDVTADLLNDPGIVSPEERGIRDTLTVVEYLRSVLEHTSKLAEVAPRRIAAHLINGWSGMVGPDIADKFSATAALGILADPDSITATRDVLVRELNRSLRDITDLTDEEKGVVKKGIADMNDLMQQINLRAREVYREAFMLVAEKDPVIKGENRSLRELYGILLLPNISQKIRESAPNNTFVQQRNKNYLAELSLETLSNFVKDSPGGDFSIISEVLKDPEIAYAETISILNSKNLRDTYIRIKTAIRTETLNTLYRAALPKERYLTETEQALIAQFAKQFVPRKELESVIQNLLTISKSVEIVTRLKDRFKNERGRFVESGIKEESLEKAENRLNAAMGDLTTLEDYRLLRKHSKKIQLLCDEVERKLEREAAVRIATRAVNGELAPVFKRKFGKEVSRQLAVSTVHYLADNIHGLSNPEEITGIVERLKELDKDKLNAVFDKQITLARAAGILDLEGEQAEGVIPQTEVDKEIISNQNQALSEQLEDLLGLLVSLDLNQKNITDENKGKLHEVINRLVRIGSGHPNAMRVLENDYPELLDRVIKLQEQLIQLQGREGLEPRY